LFATIQGTGNHHHNNNIDALLQPLAQVNPTPETTTNRPRVEAGFLFYSGPFCLPMSTLVETQTAGLHQLDNMTGLQKHPRTKAAASRYIVFFITLGFLNFLQDFANIMLSESNVFLFFTQPTSPDSPGYQSVFPGPSSTRLSGNFLSRAVCHALPRLYHVICPPVTGFIQRPGEIWPCGKYSAEQMELAPPSRETPRNYIGRS
jgi:hypothetical protein